MQRIAVFAALPFAVAVGMNFAAPALAQRPPEPNFDCARAADRVEKDIGSDRWLADVDRRLAVIYAEALRERAQDTAALAREQGEWLRQREGCGADENRVSCLLSLYEARRKELLLSLPILAHLGRPVSTADADRAIAVLRRLEPVELGDATTAANRDALSDISCRLFELFPKDAAALYASVGSSRDGWAPLCATVDIGNEVPAVRGMLNVLATIVGGENEMKCTGTMRYGIWRERGVAGALAVVDGDPDIDAYDRERAVDDARRGYRSGVAQWGLQGARQKRLLADLRRETARARPALVAYFERRFRLEPAPAERLADYWIRRLTGVWARPNGATQSYVSACFTLEDLNGYLATGTLPGKTCLNAQLLDPKEGAVLRRLLDLAIVNDYPLAAVQRLIAGGADLDPSDPKFSFETRESPLMLAAERTDVIDALLAAGADPNRGNAFGKTALMYAVQERNLAGVRRLLLGGAEIDAATGDVDGQSCTALQAGRCTALQAGRRTALMYAAWHGTPAIARALLDAHADAERTDSTGGTALAYLAKNRTLSAAQRRALRAMLHTSG